MNAFCEAISCSITTASDVCNHPRSFSRAFGCLVLGLDQGLHPSRMSELEAERGFHNLSRPSNLKPKPSTPEPNSETLNSEADM
jgi:hypothetical protein